MAEGVQVSAQSLADLQKLGTAYKGGDTELQKALRTSLEHEARPLGVNVIRAGASRMPRRGGEAARVAASRGTVAVSLRGSTVSVSIRLTNRQKDDLRGLDAGRLRHRVYGGNTWVDQKVPAHAFSRELEVGKHKVEAAAIKAVQAGLNDVARKA